MNPHGDRHHPIWRFLGFLDLKVQTSNNQNKIRLRKDLKDRVSKIYSIKAKVRCLLYQIWADMEISQIKSTKNLNLISLMKLSTRIRNTTLLLTLNHRFSKTIWFLKEGSIIWAHRYLINKLTGHQFQTKSICQSKLRILKDSSQLIFHLQF